MTFKYLLRRLQELRFSIGTPSLSHGYPILPYGVPTAIPFVSKDLEELVSYAEEYRRNEVIQNARQVRLDAVQEDLRRMQAQFCALDPIPYYALDDSTSPWTGDWSNV